MKKENAYYLKAIPQKNGCMLKERITIQTIITESNNTALHKKYVVSFW